jgi:hypothetical protein
MPSGSPPGKRLGPQTTTEDDAPAADRIFISYRRQETAYAAGWLFDRLAERFGPDQIFKDVDSIELGEDFVQEINRAVGSTDVLLALIGDRWLSITDDDGVRRLDHPDDFVRIEIEAALSRDVRIIPILIDGATMPSAAELPQSLAPLAHRQALELSPSRFQSDTSRLLAVLEKTLAEQRAPTQGASFEAPGRGGERTSGEASPARGHRGTRSDEFPSFRGGWRGRIATHRKLIGGVAVAILVVAAAVAVLITQSGSGAGASQTGESGTSTQVASLVDDFSSERYGWQPVSPTGEAEGGYQDGTYRLVATREDSAEEYSASVAMPDVQPSSADLRIEVDARMVVDTAELARGYGVFCRGEGSQDLYAFSIWKSGAEIGKFTHGSYERLAPSEPSVSSQLGETTKHLKAVCRTTTQGGNPTADLEFWVDRHKITRVKDPQEASGAAPFLKGRYGLLTIFGPSAPSNKKLGVEFDDFEVGPP